MASFLRFLDHTQRRSTVGRTPLDEWSPRRRDLSLTTRNIHNKKTSMPQVRFEPTISAGERPSTYALDSVATATGYAWKSCNYELHYRYYWWDIIITYLKLEMLIFENENHYFEAFPVRKRKYRKMEYKLNVEYVEDRTCSKGDGRLWDGYKLRMFLDGVNPFGAF
jgi:hypothetical protein